MLNRDIDEDITKHIPLPERMRPSNLDEFIGQSHIVGEGTAIKNMIKSDNLASFILWGPPGVGKTSLARIISKETKRPFHTLSAVSAGVKDVRAIIEKSKNNSIFSKKQPVLFIDEIHRFSKSQQDALLGAVEDGTITLIGATTENPSFEVITPLLSRCQVYILKSLNHEELDTLLKRALKNDKIISKINIEIQEKEALFRFSGGDARKLLNILDIVIQSQPDNSPVLINNKIVTETLQENIALYDKNGEQHYDIISAFIKSIRGSDPNGALYWLARMLEGGEDPLFIARRLIILASEDIGLANSNALLLAHSCFESLHKIGMPEGRIILSHTVIYLATSPKSNSAYTAINAAMEKAKNTQYLPVPLELRNAPTELMKSIGYGKDYKYAHSYEGNFVDQEFMPDELSGIKFYDPSDNPREQEIRKRLCSKWKKYKY